MENIAKQKEIQNGYTTGLLHQDQIDFYADSKVDYRKMIKMDVYEENNSDYKIKTPYEKARQIAMDVLDMDEDDLEL